MKNKLTLLNEGQKDKSILTRMAENYERIASGNSPIFNEKGTAAAGMLTVVFDSMGRHQYCWSGDLPPSFMLYAIKGIEFDLINEKFNPREPGRISW